LGYLEENIKYGRRLHGWTQSDLASKLNVRRTNVTNWETGTSKPSLDMLIEIANLFDFTLDEFLTSDLAASTPNSVHPIKNPVHLTKTTRAKTSLIPVAQQTDDLSDVLIGHVPEGWGFVYLPDIPAKALVFQYNGNAMMPVLKDQDGIVCTKVDSITNTKDDIVHVITTKQSAFYVAYTQKTEHGLKLIFANILEYNPITIPYEDVNEIWRVVRRITTVE
jgi:transcriptional regulator with XRE-family HTH domain